MAELPRYRRPGVLLAEFPRSDPVHIKEATRGSLQLNESLNRLSSWAYEQAAKEAHAAGEQYGAENPVTPQQLLDGTASLAQRGSIYGEAARGIQLDALTTDVEIEAQGRLSDIKGRAEAGELDAIGAMSEIKDVQDGYAEALRKVDPKASNKFRARVATAGNSLLLSIQETAAKRAIERNKLNVDNWIDTVAGDQVSPAIEAGDTVDPESGQRVTPADRLKLLRRTLVEATTAIGDPEYARGARKRFDDIVEKAQVDALVKVAGSPDFARTPDGRFDGVGAVARADKGDFGRHTSVYAAMPSDQQAKVRLAIRQASADRYTAGQHEAAELKKADELKVNQLVIEYPAAPPARKRQIESALQAISTTTGAITGAGINHLKESVKPKGDGTVKPNEVGETRLRMDIASGKIRTPEQYWDTAQRYGVSPKQVNEVFSFFITRQNRGEQQADSRLRTAAGIAPGMINPSSGRADAYISLTRQLDTEYSKALKAHQEDPKVNPAPDREGLAEELVRRRQESPKQKAIDATLKGLNDQWGTAGTAKKTGVTFTEDMDVNEVRQALTKQGIPKSNIESIIRSLQSVEAQRRQLNDLRQ